MRHLLWLCYSLSLGLFGFFYDMYRFVRYSGWRESNSNIVSVAFYKLLLSHALEKSLSYTVRRKGSGKKNAIHLSRLLEVSPSAGFEHDVAVTTLSNFLSHEDNIEMRRDVALNSSRKIVKPSVIEYSEEDYQLGILDDPESFFYSRFSLRSFDGRTVPQDVFRRALALAVKTPSVCNRQPWFVYYTSDREVMNSVLDIQNGNKPFGSDIPTLIVVAVDLRAFFSGQEHYQHWIDGGMFSMSIIYALHSLGIATCALNWSQTPWNDLKLRKQLEIQSEHTVIMCIAAGYPNRKNRVCSSPRKEADALSAELQKKHG